MRHENVLRVIAGVKFCCFHNLQQKMVTVQVGSYDYPKLMKKMQLERAKDWMLIWDEELGHAT